MATIYGRYHYAVEAIAGLVIGAAVGYRARARSERTRNVKLVGVSDPPEFSPVV